MNGIETINLKKGDSYIIDLVGMGNSGYSWIYEIDKENIVMILHEYIVSPNSKPGDQGIERFTIKGVQSGSCAIEFGQVHSWEKEQSALSVRKFLVHVM
jgi:predicted secreted protein